jgi:hypothetical protein
MSLLKEFPLTEIEMMARVAVHPLVAQCRRALQTFHKRMEASYGPNFAEEREERENYHNEEDPRGVDIMTERERAQYLAHHSRLNAARKLVKDLYKNN